MSDPFKKLRLADDACLPTQISVADSCPAHPPTAAVTPLGAMLVRHILRDGEVVLLALKPSFWFILLSSLRFIAVVSILALGAIAWEGRHNREWFYIEAAIFLLAGRIMWATLQWMGRLYVLTDLRVIRLSGVFKLDIFDCALRKIARTEVTSSSRERLCGTGSIEIIPGDDRTPAIWQTVRRPLEVNELIVSTINRAKQHGYGAAA
ncbi:MAG: hypothetical protein JWN40_3199 [Phycisphaerales bacterium]|jgi:hypothetical protein|nr:hypothetical protein [Phycisphaerales bacterium]